MTTSINVTEDCISDDWRNIDNKNYYSNIPLEILEKYCVDGGFDNNEDFNIIYDLVIKSGHILDVGCGYGRTIKRLLELDFKGKITGIELSYSLFNKSSLLSNECVTILHEDIFIFDTDKKYDCILLMWCVFCDFNRSEQQNLLKKLKYHCSDDGKIIIETLYDSKPMNFNNSSVKGKSISYEKNCEYGKIRGYIPSPKEMRIHSDLLSMKMETRIYKTSTGRERIFYIYSNIYDLR